MYPQKSSCFENQTAAWSLEKLLIAAISFFNSDFTNGFCRFSAKYCVSLIGLDSTDGETTRGGVILFSALGMAN